MDIDEFKQFFGGLTNFISYILEKTFKDMGFLLMLFPMEAQNAASLSTNVDRDEMKFILKRALELIEEENKKDNVTIH